MKNNLYCSVLLLLSFAFSFRGLGQIAGDLLNFDPLINSNTKVNCFLQRSNTDIVLVGRDATGAYNTPCLSAYNLQGVEQNLGFDWFTGVSCMVEDPLNPNSILVGNDMNFGWFSFNLATGTKAPATNVGITRPGYARVSEIRFNPFNPNQIAVTFFTSAVSVGGGNFSSWSLLAIYNRTSPADPWAFQSSMEFTKTANNSSLAASRVWDMEFVDENTLLLSGQGLRTNNADPLNDCLRLVDIGENSLVVAPPNIPGLFDAFANVRDFDIVENSDGTFVYYLGGQFLYTDGNGGTHSYVCAFNDATGNAAIWTDNDLNAQVYGAYVNDLAFIDCRLIVAGNIFGSSGTTRVVQGIVGFDLSAGGVNPPMDFYGTNLGNTQGFYSVSGTTQMSSHDVRCIFISGVDANNDGAREIFCGGVFSGYRLNGVLINSSFRNLTRLRGYSSSIPQLDLSYEYCKSNIGGSHYYTFSSLDSGYPETWTLIETPLLNTSNLVCGESGLGSNSIDVTAEVVEGTLSLSTTSGGFLQYGYHYSLVREVGVGCGNICSYSDCFIVQSATTSCGSFEANRRSHNAPVVENDANNLVLDLNKEESSPLQLFPNPSNGMVTISSDLKENERVEISVFDLAGNTVKTMQSEVYQQLMTLDFSDLASGVYLISLSSEGKSLKMKLIIEK